MDKNIDFYEKVEYCIKNEIKKLVMFIKSEENIVKMKEIIDELEAEVNLIGVTFPANEIMYIHDEEDEVKKIVPSAADGEEIRDILNKHDIKLITSSLPFEGIVIPGNNFNPYKIIEKSLTLVDISLPSLVQSVLVATDNGAITPGEKLLAVNLNLAIYTKGTNSKFLFHPSEGMEIIDIIKNKRNP